MVKIVGMDSDGGAPAWARVIALAEELEPAALQGTVSPSDGAKLVRMVLEFQRQIVRGVQVRKTGTTPRPARVGGAPDAAGPSSGEGSAEP